METLLAIVARPLGIIGRYARWSLAVGVAASLLLPGVAHLFAPALPAIVVIVLAVVFLRIDVARAIAQWRRPDRIAICVAVVLVALPLIMFPIVQLLGLDRDLVFLLVLLAAGPPIASAANYAFFLKLDAELALNVQIAATLAFPFVTPALVFGALGFAFDVDVLAVFARLAGAIAIALVASQIARLIAGRGRIARNSDVLDGLAALAMISFVLGIMAGIPERLAEAPGEVLRLLLASTIANYGIGLTIIVIALAAARFRDRPPSLGAATIAMIGGNRNLGLFLTALPAPVAAEVTPFVAVYQIPIYLTPLLLAPVYRWYVAKTRPD